MAAVTIKTSVKIIAICFIIVSDLFYAEHCQSPQGNRIAIGVFD
jgi:hypothetical protein